MNPESEVLLERENATRKQMYLEAKLKVMEDLHKANKEGKMTGKAQYAYVKAEDLISDLRPLMVKNGLTIAPIGNEFISQRQFSVASGNQWNHNIIKSTFRISHKEGGFEDVESFGESADGGDKGLNKAMTAALKYALLQTFLLQGSRDDPDEYPNQEETTERPTVPQNGTAKPSSGVEAFVVRFKDLLAACAKWDYTDNGFHLLLAQSKFDDLGQIEQNGELKKARWRWLVRLIDCATNEGHLDFCENFAAEWKAIDEAARQKIYDQIAAKMQALAAAKAVPQ